MSLSAPKLAEVQGSLARLNRVAVFSVALFVVTPVTMWICAFWRGGPELLTPVAIMTGPAALIGVVMIMAIVGDEMEARRERRRIAAVRRDAFARARWQVAYPKRTL